MTVDIFELLKNMKKEMDRLFKEATKPEVMSKIPAFCLECNKPVFLNSIVDKCPKCGKEPLIEDCEITEVSGAKKLIEFLLSKL